MRLAYELGKSEDEILAMAPDEFGRWVAFFKIITPKSGRSGKGKGGRPGVP